MLKDNFMFLVSEICITFKELVKHSTPTSRKLLNVHKTNLVFEINIMAFLGNIFSHAEMS